jgi:integrase
MAKAAKAKHIAKQYENKEVNAGLKVKKMELRTVKDLSNWYMQLTKIQRLKSYRDKIYCSVHVLKFFGNRPINQVEGDDMEKYREIRRGEGAAHGTIDNEIKLLRAMYKLSLKRKKIPSDAMPGEFVQVREVNPRRVITDEEFEAILQYVDADFADVMICAFESAMRLSEIINLTASQVHLNIQHISGNKVDYIDLGIFDTKTGARRTAPVSARLKEVLKRRIDVFEPSDPVFTQMGKRNTRKKYYSVLTRAKTKSACEKAGILYGDKVFNDRGERIGIVFHCLRHTRTPKWVEAGYSDEIVRRATGHQSLAAYQRYIKLDPHVVMRLVQENIIKTDNSGIKSLSSL